MFKIIKYLSVISALTLTAACDMGKSSYELEVKADITEFEVYGQKSSHIDIDERTVNVVLSEDVKPDDLNIHRVRFSHFARCADVNMADGKRIDLSSPVTLTLTSGRKDYVWTIMAEQPVSYYVRCEGQVGEAAINAEAHTICVTIQTTGSSYQDSRMKLKILDMKLGRAGSRVVSTTGYKESPQEISGFPVVLDCFFERTFTVEDHGETVVWTMITLPA